MAVGRVAQICDNRWRGESESVHPLTEYVHDYLQADQGEDEEPDEEEENDLRMEEAARRLNAAFGGIEKEGSDGKHNRLDRPDDVG